MNIIRNIVKHICLKIKFCKLKCKIKTNFIPINTKIGKYCKIDSGVKIGKFCEIGDFSYINQNTIIEDYVKIGKFCSISQNVKIAPFEHPMEYVSTHPIFYDKNYLKIMGLEMKNNENFTKKKTKETIIGNDVWIGMEVIIKKGIKIGDGAIIGAGAVVTKDIEPYAIVGGVPAKIIRYRFDEETIKKLEHEQWWDKGLEYIKDNYIKMHIPNQYVKEIKR